MSKNRENIRILLVEDDLANQFGTTSILKHCGYQVAVANNGREALDFLEKNDCDLVLMDCAMPVLGGYEATVMIRDQSTLVRNHAVPVVALTAHALPEECAQGREVGMNDYLTKPYLIEDLLKAVEKWAGHRFEQRCVENGRDANTKL